MAKARSKDERFKEAVLALKAEGFNTRAVLLIDKFIQALLVAWPFVTRTVEDVAREDVDAWDWIRFDPTEWKDMAGLVLSHSEFYSLFLRMKTMRLIYPDGTYPKEVDDYLVNLATNRIGP